MHHSQIGGKCISFISQQPHSNPLHSPNCRHRTMTASLDAQHKYPVEHPLPPPFCPSSSPSISWSQPQRQRTQSVDRCALYIHYPFQGYKTSSWRFALRSRFVRHSHPHVVSLLCRILLVPAGTHRKWKYGAMM